MYKHFIPWLREINSDLELEKEYQLLLARKRDLRTELCYLQREETIAYHTYSRLKLAYSKARCEYHQVDFKLATLDGRLTVCEEIKAEEIREKNLKSITDQLSADERAALLAELEGMED